MPMNGEVVSVRNLFEITRLGCSKNAEADFGAGWIGSYVTKGACCPYHQ